MTRQNHRFTLAARPVGLPKRTDFTYDAETVRDLADGEILVRNRYLSLDPAMRGWMNDAKSYVKPIGLGEVIRAAGIGEVVESKHGKIKVGDHVGGILNIQEYTVMKGEHAQPVNPAHGPLPKMLSVLGYPGLTAYFGLFDVGKPVAGQTVVVSGAAGAVGSVVGQLAKIHGCHVVGIAGGADKCKLLTELGFDVALDYKTGDLKRALREACPKGIDVYFDNVGGDLLDLALTQLAMKARIVICGAISQYNNTTPVKGPANYLSLLVNRASMTGMVIMDYTAQFPEAVAKMSGWLAEGKLQSREHIVKGLDTFPETLNMLFSGENTGKLILEV